MKNKVLKRIVLFFVIILIIVVIYFISIHFNGFLNQNNEMSREEIVELLEKGTEYPNYYYSSKDVGLLGWIIEKRDNNTTETYIKDNVIKVVVNGSTIRWENYNTNEIINIMDEKNGKNYAAITNVENYKQNSGNDNQMGFDFSLISQEDVFDTDFEYMGIRKFKGRETILVKVWNKKSSKLNATIFYIDKDTGLIMRRIDYSALGFIKIDCDRNVKLDIVTDADVQKPDLNGYEILSDM